MAQRYAAATTKGDIMKKALLVWIGFVLAFVAAGAVVGGIKFGGGVGSYVVAAIFAAAAWRTWRLAGDGTKPPTEVGG